MLTVGLVQINNSFSDQNYFPLSAGLLQAYAQKDLENSVTFLPIVHTRQKIDEAVKSLLSADVVGFSVYLWNFKISLAIAENLKNTNSDITIVFGGHHVPSRNTEDFLRKNSFIDVACHGDGEKVFTSILKNDRENWQGIPSISYLAKNNCYIETEKTVRDKNLDYLPSPYLTGVFDELMAKNRDMRWVGMLETNRGCPFSCAWCDWHGSKLGQWNLERVFQEIDWFAKNKIEFVNCVDANFGLLPRDLEIASYFAETKKKYGYPQAVSIQSTKNVQERSFQIQKILADEGMNRAVVMSIQSLNPKTLKAVGRSNITLKDYEENQRRLNKLGINTVTDLILGQPEETYDSWVNGIDALISSGQHNKIQFGNLTNLPNSAMANSEYIKRYGIETVESAMVNNHGFLPGTDGIVETQDLVIATSTMPTQDWVRARVFSWMMGLLHFDKILQIPNIVLHHQAGLNYKELIEFFSEGKFDGHGQFPFPTLDRIRRFFLKQANNIQNGGYEFCHSTKWLNIFWPADEYMFIELCAENKLHEFYRESVEALLILLETKGIDIDLGIVFSAIRLNKALIKLPERSKDLEIDIDFNVWEYYRSLVLNEPISLEKKKVSYLIDRSSQQWSSLSEWLQKVVWWGHRKGDYLYQNINPIARS